MGLTTSSIPDRVDREEFRKLLIEGNPLPNTAIESDIIFNGICHPEGYVVRDKLLELNLASDVFLSHEWGYDGENRPVHDTVGQINIALKRAGLITWFDEEQEKRYTTGGRFPASDSPAKYHAKKRAQALAAEADRPKTSGACVCTCIYVNVCTTYLFLCYIVLTSTLLSCATCGADDVLLPVVHSAGNPATKTGNNIVAPKVKYRKKDLNCRLNSKQTRIQAIENTQVCVLRGRLAVQELQGQELLLHIASHVDEHKIDVYGLAWM